MVHIVSDFQSFSSYPPSLCLFPTMVHMPVQHLSMHEVLVSDFCFYCFAMLKLNRKFSNEKVSQKLTIRHNVARILDTPISHISECIIVCNWLCSTTYTECIPTQQYIYTFIKVYGLISTVLLPLTWEKKKTKIQTVKFYSLWIGSDCVLILMHATRTQSADCFWLLLGASSKKNMTLSKISLKTPLIKTKQERWRQRKTTIK